MLPLITLPNSTLQLSALCLGSGAFDVARTETEIDQLYEAFREAGGNCFDTAHCYSFWIPNGLGVPERKLGQVIRRHGDVGRVHIIDKGGHPAVPPDYPRPDQYLSPEVIASDIRESLGRLQCDCIDLYFLHRDDSRVPVAEIIDVLNQHISAGRLRAIGASNWSIARLAQARAYAIASRLHGFVASQPRFNLAHPNAPVPDGDPSMRYLTVADIAWHRTTGLPVICYSSTANGYFASGGARGREAYSNPISRARLARAEQLGRELGISVGQIALAYIRSQEFPAIPILGTSKLQHLIDAISSANVILNVRQLHWLERAEEPLALNG